MRTLATLALGGLLAVGLLAGGCARAAEPAAPRTARGLDRAGAPPGPTCHQVCQRTFGTCAREVLRTTAQVSPELMEKFTRTGMLAFYQQAGYKRCVQMCDRAAQPVAASALIRVCLGHASCDAYAACLKPRGGISGATSGGTDAPR